MFNSILFKEWIKIKPYFLTLIVLISSALVHFWFNLDFAFTTIEPESMMWYKFSQFGDKPYYYFSYIFILIAVSISLAQFLPERVSNRVKIITHLPMSISNALYMHLAIGVVAVLILSAITMAGLLIATSSYYPTEIVQIILKDIVLYIVGSVITYIAMSSAIIEKDRLVSFIKLSLALIFLFLYFKIRYTSIDYIFLVYFFVFVVYSLDSLYSIKEQRYNKPLVSIISIFAVAYFIFVGMQKYQNEYKKEFNRYYIFYSSIAKDFVYQKNFGDHQYEYGLSNKDTFDMKEYKSYLPFVYWKDLDIQRKLPVVIDGKEYTRAKIKRSRLGFSYNPKMLNKKEIDLYPLINPNSKEGVIKFPEEQFVISSNSVNIYDYDHGRLDEFSNKLTKMFADKGFTYPAKGIWGKSTNMKPYDKGYVILDSNKRLFNLSRSNDITTLKEIKYPNIDIEYIKVSENRQRKLAGYAIDKESNFYLLTWDLEFIKLDLDGFDYKSDKLKLIANPLYYLIRYDDSKEYNAVVFDKQYNKLNSIVLK
jgi:hypothetical protein